MTSRPLVLITPDAEVRQGRRGPSPLAVLERAYADAVYAAGGLGLLAPYSDDEDVLAELVARADALVLAGGDFDVDPALFGEPPHEKLGTLKPERTRFELALLERSLVKGIPVLGICGGMQLINVLRGGDLWQDLDSQHKTPVEHQQKEPKHLAGHCVEVLEGTRLAALVGAGVLGVNSTHHQAVRSVGRGLVASAVSPDGLVEAIEDPAHGFLLGVQWHPEAMPGAERQQALYRGLVYAARS
jgi:putative glutamine amidotransferase